jgi:hypothetical protein
LLRDEIEATREPISPELVLVDPELAELARARLPERPDFIAELASKRTVPAATEAIPPPEPVEPAPPPSRRRAVSTLALLGATALGLLVGVEIGGRNTPETLRNAQFIPTQEISSSATPRRRQPKASGVQAAKAARRAAKPSRTRSPSGSKAKRTRRARSVHRAAAPKSTRPSSPTLTWSRVRGASYYDVRLFRGPVRILDLWPSKPKVQVPRSWVYGGAHYRLQAGRYRWFVYPGVGKRSQLRLQKLHKTGVLKVPR